MCAGAEVSDSCLRGAAGGGCSSGGLVMCRQNTHQYSGVWLKKDV